MNARSWVRPVAVAGGLALAVLAAGCGTTPPPASLAANACADFSFPVYFQMESDQLTTEALQLIAESATRARACPLAGIAIQGLGGENAGLAARRAAAVTKALAANGLTAPAQVDTATPNHGLSLLHRRADVSLHFAAQP